MAGQRLMKFPYYEVVSEKRTNSNSIVFIAIIIGITLVCLLYIALYTKVLEKSYRLQELEKKISKMEKETEKAEVEVEMLSSFKRIESIAIGEIGMKVPDEIIFVYLTKENRDEMLSSVDLIDKDLLKKL